MKISLSSIVQMIATVLLVVPMAILFGGNFYNPDYFAYKHVYDHIGFYQVENLLGERFESGFIFLYQIGNKLGLSYQHFLGVLGVLCLLIIVFTVRQYTRRTFIVVGLYLIYPFFMDVVQIRNFVAMVIFFAGIRFYRVKNVTDILYSIGFILLATSIHKTMILFLVFILLRRLLSLEKWLKLGAIVAVVGTLMTNIIPSLLLMFFPNDLLETYLGNRNITFANAIFIVVSQLALMWISHFNYKLARSDSKLFHYKEILETIFFLNIILLFLYPLFTVNTNIIRFARNISLFTYLGSAIVSKEGHIAIWGQRLLSNVILFTTTVALWYVNIYHLLHIPVWRTVLENNIFWK